MAHPLLEDIFNEPTLWVNQKKKSKITTILILLPPIDTLPKSPRTFDYLASNVIPIDLNDDNYRQPRPSLSTSLSRITSPRTHVRSGSFSSWGDHSNNKNEFKTMNGKIISTIRNIHNDAIIYNQDDFVSCILLYLGTNTLIIPRDITMTTTKRVNNNNDNSNTKVVNRRNSMERNNTMTTTRHKNTNTMINNKRDKKNSITTNRKEGGISMDDDNNNSNDRDEKQQDDNSANNSSFLLQLFDKASLNISIREFCDMTLIDDNIASIHNRMKEILDTTFTLLDENNNKELNHLLKDIEDEEIYEQLE
ncbi:hypothetical protein INT45_011703, partial [Circinella minor]